MGGETYSEMFLCGHLEVVLDSKNERLLYEPHIPLIFVPTFDGEDIASYPQTDRFLQRLGLGTVVVLEECDLVHSVSGNYELALGQTNERSVTVEVAIRKSGEIRFSNMMFMNPSQYYNTQTTGYNRVPMACRIMVASSIRYNIIPAMQNKYNMATNL